MYIHSLIFLCCSAGLIFHNGNIIAASSEKTSALVRQLIAADDIHVPPNADQPGQPVTVTVSLSAAGIQHDRRQPDVVILHGTLELQWKNSRLTWEPQQHNNITLVQLPVEHVWLPDITLYNRASASASSSCDDARSQVYPANRRMLSVHSEGSVTWIAPVSFPLSCNNTVGGGEVHCAIKLASWTYHGLLIDLKAGSDKIQAIDYVDSSPLGSNYRITNSTVVRNVVFYACCPELFPSIDMTFTAKRAAAS
ncbi:acetylcholine receptor subunit alpha-like [Paramacrobiotus metropolitanus]|uniref:acetylcholine receptor subunit alpha-like n=1 Tax=Paramacrobiotus metropolitanus TaxID=2943436 RepID=UPI002445FC03|nr:acetylcholine receptor subunit alpha-like [Paramacrobiotus metropolitanus]